MNIKIRLLLNEISQSDRKNLNDIQEKIEIVQDEAESLIKLSKKSDNPKLSAKYWQEGDSILSQLSRACIN